jgi:hypothetical protein
MKAVEDLSSTRPSSATPCPGCGAPLEHLGGNKQTSTGKPPVEIDHYACAACRARWVHHSVRGWRRTEIQLEE